MMTLHVPRIPGASDISAVREPGALASTTGSTLQADFDHLLHALCVQRRSATVLCPDHDELDAVAGHLARCLRRRPGVRLERLQATGTESLLGRFNGLVEAMPLDAARRDDPNAQNLTLWVMHLSRSLELPEVRLLLNMVRGFPGTGVRLLLLCSGEAASGAAAKVVSSWGSSLHRWVLQREVRPRELPALEDTTELARVASPVAELAGMPVAAPLPRWRRSLQKAGSRCARLWTWCGANRLAARAGTAAAQIRRTGRPFQRRLLWGFGGVLVSISGAAAAWWQVRPADAGSADMSPLRRPVPEIVELLEDARPTAVRQGKQS